MSPLVFISHASADRKLADAICVALELRGIPCWIATRDVPWFQKAAQQGLAISQLNIGFLYQDGLGVGQDYSQAMTWYQKAAQQHLPPAIFDIGLLYTFGLGVPKDCGRARAFMLDAASLGLTNAKSWLKAPTGGCGALIR